MSVLFRSIQFSCCRQSRGRFTKGASRLSGMPSAAAPSSITPIAREAGGNTGVPRCASMCMSVALQDWGGVRQAGTWDLACVALMLRRGLQAEVLLPFVTLAAPGAFRSCPNLPSGFAGPCPLAPYCHLQQNQQTTAAHGNLQQLIRKPTTSQHLHLKVPTASCGACSVSVSELLIDV
ncbi:unnamed protein product [Symbiodinium natans]|uniref:Uncharacterized protein n=1 Tax=Symbiodinium natans TaxID=878477 RepID=A0A812INJ6_9DINO|nr:unnamed protein product [Symbiodinium natans]